MPRPQWPLGLPTRLRPVRVLGGGAASVVWQARDTEVGADRAVKVIYAAPGSGIDPARRAETEARALARLDGVAGIVALHEVGRTDAGAAWLVHDLVTGGTLADRAPCASVEVVQVGSSLATTLAAAHHRSVHHGDISPTNVVFDGDGQALLADFGMAGLGHAPDDPGGLTPAFAAPERLRGAPPSDASDVYSLTVTLRTVSSSPVPVEVQRLLTMGAAASPADRPSATELADALRSLLPR